MSYSATEVADRLELRALVEEYGFAADARDAARFSALFAAGGELHSYAAGAEQPLSVHRGAAELASVVTDVLPGFGATFHQVSNQSCRIAGDRASGEVYCAAHHLAPPPRDRRALVMLIRYADEYRRQEGEWRIERREARVLWSEWHETHRNEDKERG